MAKQPCNNCGALFEYEEELGTLCGDCVVAVASIRGSARYDGCVRVVVAYEVEGTIATRLMTVERAQKLASQYKFAVSDGGTHVFVRV